MNIKDFKGKKILVVGDLMLDKTIWGHVYRTSPEAPVPIVNVEKETVVLGGAGNTANNLVSLGAKAHIIGIAGENSDVLLSKLKEKKISESIVIDKSRPTTEKVRVISDNKQLLRIDYEKTEVVDEEIIEKIKNEVNKLINDFDGVIISDYSKGLNSEELMQYIIETANSKGKIVVVDSKSKNYKIFKNATIITPSHLDASRITGIKGDTEENVAEIGKHLQKELNTKVLMTRGEKGMSIFEGDKVMNIKTKAKDVYDVTGAGDTVVAVLTLALSCGASLKEAAEIATSAAAIVIGKVGTVTVSLNELAKEI